MRPACLYPLFSSVETIKGIGPKAAKLFKNLLGKDILLYLLFHRPIAILSRPRLTDAGQVKNGDRPTFKVRILSHIRPHSRKAPYRILCQIESFKGTELEIVFFNYHKDYLVRQLPEGEIRCISGAVEWYNGRLQMTPRLYYRRFGRLEDPLDRAGLSFNTGLNQQNGRVWRSGSDKSIARIHSRMA